MRDEDLDPESQRTVKAARSELQVRSMPPVIDRKTFTVEVRGHSVPGGYRSGIRPGEMCEVVVGALQKVRYPGWRLIVIGISPDFEGILRPEDQS